MSQLKLFEDRYEVTILTQEDVIIDFKGDFLVRAKDVANVLEYASTDKFTNIIKKKYLILVKNSDISNSPKWWNRKLHNTGELFVTSFGLNQALVSSTMPKVEPFQDWLYEEVLPSIQKHGYYTMNFIPNAQALSPEFQMFKCIFDATAKVQLDQIEQAKRLSVVEQRQEHITDVLSLNPTEWRKKTEELLNRIAHARGDHSNYLAVRLESYQKLEERARCKLLTRLMNRRQRMALEGVAKSKIDKVNKLDIIAEDAKLTEIYLAIVKEMAIKYGVESQSEEKGDE